MTKLIVELKDGTRVARIGVKVAAACFSKKYYFTVDGSVFTIPKSEIKSMYIEN